MKLILDGKTVLQLAITVASSLFCTNTFAGLESFGSDQHLVKIDVVEYLEHKPNKASPYEFVSQRKIYSRSVDISDKRPFSGEQIGTITYTDKVHCLIRPMSKRSAKEDESVTLVGIKVSGDVVNNLLNVGVNYRTLAGFKELEYCDGRPRKTPIISEFSVNSGAKITDIGNTPTVLATSRNTVENLNFNRTGKLTTDGSSDRITMEVLLSSSFY
ncbi:hypothetical protein [Photobacterium kishitanii]|uniref:Uncharacterized protein n=1 Tax=Photobacterium kishitanii TaxID=318456 RepID=A0A2T3KMM4_9GAMM|nr:hypothetical protein [Photobacterium kishitanii]PSV01038.1 hypothetical protein C9J27_03140 [Photobacterium kishitanii]